jgi:hypothetical protein
LDGLGTLGWMGFLATRVAPSRLVEVAALRAVRGARNRLAPPLAPSRPEILSALGCDDARAVATLLARPTPRPVPWTPAELRRALDRHLPGERERAVARAEAAAAGRVVVFGREVDVSLPGGGTDWQLDPIHGGRFACGEPHGTPPQAPGLDPKMAWAVGRGEHWVALACGAVLDERGGAGLARALDASVQDFVAANPVGRGIHWTSAMEVALRAWHLLVARWVASARREPPDPRLALDLVRLFVASGRFILAHLEDAYPVPNNHLATDWLGLLACSAAVPEWPESPRWRELAVAGLRETCAEQVHDEGTSFEGSVPYQRYALELFAAGAALAHAAGRGLGRDFARRLAGLFSSTRALLARSGELPQIGDNDSGHALAFRQRGSTEGGYLLPLGAALLRDGGLLLRPGAADAVEVAFLFGPPALERLARARPGPAPASVSFPASGFHALRRGPFEAFVSCGPNGQRGIGGHSHNDKLALELHVAGRLVVSDPGNPFYAARAELRNAFRATRAHATVTVDGLEQAPVPTGRLFALPEAAAARLVSFDDAGPGARLAGEHRGFAAVGVVHAREVIATAAGLAVIDRLAGAGAHAVELRWPLASRDARVRAASRAEADAFARLARGLGISARPDPARVVEVPLGAAGRLAVGLDLPAPLEPELGVALRSPGYAELEPGAVIVAAGRLLLPAALVTLFVLTPEGDNP